MKIGDRIKEQRKKRGITQRELAQKLNVSQAMIAQYENDMRNPKLETLQKIAEALEISLSDLTNIDVSICGKDVFIGTPESCRQFEFISKLKNSKDGQMLKLLNKLNDNGQNKAIEQVELLTKIPEYRKTDHLETVPDWETAADQLIQEESDQE